MPEDNILTDIERTLKDELTDTDNIILNGGTVPVRVVTPDPDFVELQHPCMTLQLTDFRRDLSRIDNERHVEKDLDGMVAKVKKRSEPYNFHYAISVHSERSRIDRIILGQLIYFIDEHPVITSSVFGNELYLHRDIAFRERSKKRSFDKSFDIIVRTQLEARYEEIVPLVQEHRVEAHSYNRKEE